MGRVQWTPGSLRQSWMPTLLGALFCISAVTQVYERGAPMAAIDFYQHWAVVHAVREHIVPTVYSAEGRKTLARTFAERAARPDASDVEKLALSSNLGLYGGKLETVGTPAVYAALSPFVGDDYGVDRRVFLIAQIAAVIAACLLFGALLGLPAWVGFLLAAWAVWFFEPVISHLIVGSVSSFQWLWLGLVVLISRTERSPWRDGLVGGALGLAAMAKPNLLLIVAAVLLPLAVDRRIGPLLRTAGGVVVGGAACLLGSAAWFGSLSVWGEWANQLPRLVKVIAGVDAGNFGLVAAVYEIAHRDVSRPVTLIVASIGVLAIVRSRRAGAERSPDEVLFAIAVGGAATALGAPIFWLHYGVLVVPAAFLCWRSAQPQWMTLLAVLFMSSLARALEGDLVRFAVGIALGQIALFALALRGWTHARRTQSLVILPAAAHDMSPPG